MAYVVVVSQTMKMSERRRNWSFTLKEYSVHSFEVLSNIKCRAILYVTDSLLKEVNGVVAFKEPVYLSKLRKLFAKCTWFHCESLFERRQWLELKPGFVLRGTFPLIRQELGVLGVGYWQKQLQLEAEGKLEECNPHFKRLRADEDQRRGDPELNKLAEERYLAFINSKLDPPLRVIAS